MSHTPRSIAQPAASPDQPLSASPDPATPLGLIGGIGLTEVHVYAQRPAPDGTFSGCPHVHAVVDEGYFVLQGTGRVEFHDRMHGLRTLDLHPGDYIHFPPLVMHRLISDGDLIILGMMGSAGLAERGEARIYFGPAVDADAERFTALMDLPQRAGLAGALERRDAAVTGYMHLMTLWRDDRPAYFAELERFITLHCRVMAGRVMALQHHLEHGPLAWAHQTARRLSALPRPADTPPQVHFNRRGTDSALGMCGVLRPVLSLQTLSNPPAPSR